METIKLANDFVLEIIPMGITTVREGDFKGRAFSFVSDLSYQEIETEFNNKQSISSIRYFSGAGHLLKTYTDCIALKSLTKEFNKEYEDGIIADVYTVVLALA